MELREPTIFTFAMARALFFLLRGSWSPPDLGLLLEPDMAAADRRGLYGSKAALRSAPIRRAAFSLHPLEMRLR